MSVYIRPLPVVDNALLSLWRKVCVVNAMCFTQQMIFIVDFFVTSITAKKPDNHFDLKPTSTLLCDKFDFDSLEIES